MRQGFRTPFAAGESTRRSEALSISWEIFETHFERRQQFLLGMIGHSGDRTVAGHGREENKLGPMGYLPAYLRGEAG